ncbi:SdrD B-like domain-containing protein [Methylobacterium soli]|uniref:DUF4214 domain-containing protein n=1 Tax=Methylobacterium soli TaxID=553447 RepID=A0A6L3T884_9HYPH|nr:SdrD B-like domain-containing protein [Methylobacterium soli]KAB1081791.1 DUF4214 domain-containing protein [Methylobacterium soli]GJE43512.1 hypothetical protein AEGHOMDF_2691 [Methylobacterium soli]
MATITGKLFFDFNANNVQDPGEGPWTPTGIQLLDTTGAVVATTSADAGGSYQFSNLAAGTYSILLPTSGGYRAFDGIMRSPGDNKSLISGIKVDAGANVQLNEGVFSHSYIEGTVANDLDGNGIKWAGETGLAGETVQLYDKVGNLLSSATTDANGAYFFYGLKQGDYVVKTAVDSSMVSTTGDKAVTLGVSQGATTVDLGARDKASAVSISGTAYVDSSNDHVRTAGEAGIEGVSVALQNDKGYVVRTTLTDKNGNYTFDNIDAAKYKVYFASPANMKGSGKIDTSISTGQLTPGSKVSGFDVGFVKDPDVVKTDDIPKNVKEINVVIRGQSNTVYASDYYGLNPYLKSEIEKLLGFDGVNQKVNVIGTEQGADRANTERGGTGLLTDWLDPVGGDYKNGWNAKFYELGFLSALGKLPDAQKAAPTAFVWLHNETDSYRPGTTVDKWMSGARYEAGLARAVLGQDVGSVPYMFVNAIPFPTNGYGPQPIQNQNIRVGQATLTEDPDFNAAYATRQAGDVDMSGDGAINGFHINVADAQTLLGRVAKSIAEKFKDSAISGSPIALAGGNIDNEGPTVSKVETVAGHPDQLLLTFKYDVATKLGALSGPAADGTSWSLRTDYQDDSANAQATKAQIIGGDKLLLTFDHAVNAATDKLFYDWGGDRIATSQSASGVGAAVYDSNNVPVSADPRGVAVNPTAVVVTPTTSISTGQISGHLFSDTNADGVQGSGEASLGAGFKVDLYAADGTTQLASTATDASGNYSFGSLAAGDYAVRFQSSGNKRANDGTVTADGFSWVKGFHVDGTTTTTLNEGFFPGATIHAFNATGAKTEIVDGTHVLVTFDHDVSPADQLFYAWGSQRLALPGGPGNGNAIYDNNDVPVWTSPYGVSIGDTKVAAPAVPVLSTGRINGHTFNDANANGVQGTGEGAPDLGLIVDLYDAAGTQLIKTTATDLNGNYSFGDLAAGTYNVRFHTPGNSGATDGTVKADGFSWVSNVKVDGTNPTTFNEGIFPGGDIKGIVYDNTDGNGSLGGSDRLHDGVTVQLYDSKGNLAGTTVTSNHDAGLPGTSGVYSFYHLKPDTYAVKVVPPDGKVAVNPSVSLNVTSGADVYGITLGLRDAPVAANTSSIGGHLFFDGNADNAQGPGEANLFAGFPVKLYSADGTQLLKSTTTDAGGNYSFGSLAAGTYSVRFDTFGNYRTNDGTVTADGFSWVKNIKVDGTNSTTLNEGVIPGADIRGVVYDDTDGNGSLGGSDALHDGVTVQLYDSKGNLAGTTVTSNHDAGLPGKSGVYSFYHLAPDTYTVKVVPPDGKVAINPSVSQTLGVGADAQAVNLGLHDVAPLTVQKVSVSGNGIDINGSGHIGAGKEITFTVQYSDTVTVGQAAQKPDLLLSSGAIASYSGGSGTNTLTFKYVVQAGHDIAHLEVSNLEPNGSTISGPHGAGVPLTVNVALPGFLAIDTTPPVVHLFVDDVPQHVAATSASGAEVDFGGLSTDNIDGTADGVIYKDGNTVVQPGDTFAVGSHTITVIATDAAGNVSDSATFSFTVDAFTGSGSGGDNQPGSGGSGGGNQPGSGGSPGSAGSGGDGTSGGDAQAGSGGTATTTNPANAKFFGNVVHDASGADGQVYALFHALLGRNPDVTGQEFYAAKLQSGLSLADLAQALLDSAEYKASHPTSDNASYVQGLYQSALHRAADPDGLKYWTGVLDHGGSQAQVASQIALSSEAQHVLQDAFTAGVFAPDHTASDIARLYYGLLDRAPDVSGLQSYSNAVSHGVQSLAQVAQTIIASPEFTASHVGLSDAAFVDLVYQGALDRHADPGGLNGWTNALAHGASRADIAVGIAESPEAHSHLIGKIEAGWIIHS